MIRIVFFAALKEALDCEGLELAVADGTSLSQIIEQLVEQRPHWQQHLSSASLLMAINHEMAEPEDTIKNNDEVAFFPPVTGG